MEGEIAKREARRGARRAREALAPDERAQASASIRAHVAGLPELRAAGAVAGYAAVEAEVDLDPLLDVLLARGVAVHLPVVDGTELELSRVRDLATDLVSGYRGVREPAPGLPRDPAPLIDVVLVPGVAFAPDGSRVGYGGGHYDRLLARLGDAVRVGVAFSAQVMPHVPLEPHDERLDVLVTEAGAVRSGRERPSP